MALLQLWLQWRAKRDTSGNSTKMGYALWCYFPYLQQGGLLAVLICGWQLHNVWDSSLSINLVHSWTQALLWNRLSTAPGTLLTSSAETCLLKAVTRGGLRGGFTHEGQLNDEQTHTPYWTPGRWAGRPHAPATRLLNRRACVRPAPPPLLTRRAVLLPLSPVGAAAHPFPPARRMRVRRGSVSVHFVLCSAALFFPAF